MAKKPVKKVSKDKKVTKSSKIDSEALEAALKIMTKGDLVEFLYEEKDIKIQLKKLGAGMSMQAPQMMAPPAPIAAAAAPEVAEDEHANANVVKSPIVGTFYRAPSPDSPPFVNVGDMIEPGKTICIIEAMKIMNEIKSEVKGKVKEILVENAQAIEFNQPLIVVEK